MWRDNCATLGRELTKLMKVLSLQELGQKVKKEQITMTSLSLPDKPLEQE